MMRLAPAVVVLTRDMNDKLFGGANSVGKTIRLDNEPYTVSGVLDDWRLLPRFYRSGHFARLATVTRYSCRLRAPSTSTWQNRAALNAMVTSRLAGKGV